MISEILDYELLQVKKFFNLGDENCLEYGVGSYHRLFRVNGKYLILKKHHNLVEVDEMFLNEHFKTLE